MRRYAVALSVLIGLGLFVSVRDAAAQFTICNKSSEPTLRVAIGYGTAAGAWLAKGWFTIAKGECQVVLPGELEEQYYYLYAVAPANEWEADEDETEAGTFCVRESADFEIDRNQHMDANNAMTCEASGLATKDFFEIDAGDSTEYTYELED